MGDRDIMTEDQPTDVPPEKPVGWRVRLGRFIRPRRRWCLGTRLVVTATTGWLLFVVAHRLVSGRTSLWAPLDLIPPFMFVVVPALLLVVAPLARPVRWRVITALILTLVLGAGQSGINVATLWYTPPPAPPGAITLVAWNTEFWDQDWRTSDGNGYSPDFYDYLRKMDADVYLLAEYLYVDTSAGDMMASKWTADMALRIDKLPELRREFPGYEVATSGELITLSRLPIVGRQGLDITPWLPADQKQVPEVMRDWPTSYTVETLRTDIQVNGTVVSFYNTQVNQPPLDWRLYDGGSRDSNQYAHARREASYQALRTDIEANDHPVVLGGDLNTTPAMGMLRLLPEKLVDHTQALPSLYPATWTAGYGELWRLDWMFTTPDIAVHRYEMPGAAGLSDHRPQQAVLSVGH
ncbi:endonuclease/exonuclease/phosphatase family protein [Streptosporangium sp. 'caverna']|uniref:endonuclease/exonuclease/phosphatase family protein n=1 Tax=Streptosporangium sp. 'caverna' TaxID=2202249 RepID=UPI0013A6B710|nr:endonuclease/exonuclease/phosphatase family protein [Streptosporangium sp. 'caverna']